MAESWKAAFRQSLVEIRRRVQIEKGVAVTITPDEHLVLQFIFRRNVPVGVVDVATALKIPKMQAKHRLNGLLLAKKIEIHGHLYRVIPTPSAAVAPQMPASAAAD